MKVQGGCYCGAVRYEAEGDALFKGQCHCRECQYITGGGGNLILGLPETEFKYTKGEPAIYRRDDLDEPVTREFCGKCGTPLTSRAPAAPGVALIKIGSLDDPAVFGKPDMAIYMDDTYAHHVVDEGVMQFPKAPG